MIHLNFPLEKLAAKANVAINLLFNKSPGKFIKRILKMQDGIMPDM